MLKFLLWLLVGVYVYRRWIAPARNGSSTARPDSHFGNFFSNPGNNSGGQQTERHSVDAVRCRQCGMYVPRDEAVCNGADCFCSPQHEQEFRHAPHERHDRSS